MYFIHDCPYFMGATCQAGGLNPGVCLFVCFVLFRFVFTCVFLVFLCVCVCGFLFVCLFVLVVVVAVGFLLVCFFVVVFIAT